MVTHPSTDCSKYCGCVWCEVDETELEIQQDEEDDDNDACSRLLPSTSSGCVTSSAVNCDIPCTEQTSDQHFVDAYSVARAVT